MLFSYALTQPTKYLFQQHNSILNHQLHKHFMPCVFKIHSKQEKAGLWFYGSVKTTQQIIIGFVCKHLDQGTE